LVGIDGFGARQPHSIELGVWVHQTHNDPFWKPGIYDQCLGFEYANIRPSASVKLSSECESSSANEDGIATVMQVRTHAFLPHEDKLKEFSNLVNLIQNTRNKDNTLEAGHHIQAASILRVTLDENSANSFDMLKVLYTSSVLKLKVLTILTSPALVSITARQLTIMATMF
jgi:hypothetical protein